MLDGWLARKMNWTSPFGTFLDSLADLLFFLVVIAKVVLTITLPAFLLWGALTVALIRCISYVIGYFRFHQFTSLHTYLNKLTGLLLFLSPIVLLIVAIKPFGVILLTCALLSSVEELIIVSTTQTLDKNVATFFQKKKTVSLQGHFKLGTLEVGIARVMTTLFIKKLGGESHGK